VTWLGLAVSRTTLRAVAVTRGRAIWVAERPITGVAEIADGIAELATERPPRVTRTRVVLEGDLVQVKLVEGLPRIAEDRLRGVIALQAGRWFLRNGKPLITGATWVGTGERALAAAADADTLERILDGAGRAGLRVEAVGPAVSTCAALLPDGEWTWPADPVVECVTVRDRRIAVLRRSVDDHALVGASLPPPPGLAEDMGSLFPAFAAAQRRPVPVLEASALTARNHTTDRRRTFGLGLLALACWLTAAGIFEARTRRAAAAAAHEMATLRPMLAQALAVERDMAQAEDALGRIAEARATRSTDAGLLATVTRALPDSAYLLSLRRSREGRVTLMGVAPSAARVVTALGAAAGVQGAALEGGITRAVTPLGVRERFRIVFSWHRHGKSDD
jgi:hypothetical protein